MFLFYYILVFVCRNRFLLATVKIRNIQKTYKHTHTLTYVAKNIDFKVLTLYSSSLF